MNPRVFSFIENSLYTLIALLIPFLIQDGDLGSSARQVNGNLVTQQQQSTIQQQVNNSLPALSERANGVNSRYLSAAGTASLAAATVAAAQNGGIASGNANQDANRNFLLHQQQQQHQHQQHQQQSQPQVTQPTTTANQGTQQQPSQQQQQQQHQQQSQQTPVGGRTDNFNNVQQVAPPGTPVMSTTFTFNPATGQFVPTDLATGPLVAGPTNTGGLYGGNPFLNNLQQQQQQSLNSFLSSNLFSNINGNNALPLGYQNQNRNPQSSLNQLAALGSSLGLLPNQQLSNGALSQYQLNQQRQFNRRAGLPRPSAGGFANSIYYPQQQQSSLIHGGSSESLDNDNGGFFPQQVTSNAGALLGNLDLIGNLLDQSSYVASNLLPSPSNSYQQQSQQQQQQQQQQQPWTNQQGSNQQQVYNEQHSIASQPSSLSSSILLPNTPPFTVSSASSVFPEHRNEQCVAADNRHGTCYQASECIRRGGTPMGRCGNGGFAASAGDFPGSSHVCCLFDVTCGQFATERFVYFRNPNYPNTFDQSRMCRARIGKLDKSVCQLRLDLLRFDVAKPSNGNCSTDMFVVSGQNENYVVPKICGLNDGQHYYVGVDESGMITLHMMMMGFYRRSFEILVTQIPCKSDYSAPAHCLQYYMGTQGTIKSFNYDDDGGGPHSSANYDLLQQDGSTVSLTGNPTAPYGLQFAGNNNQQRQIQLMQRYGNNHNHLASDLSGGYPNDLDYTMCIRKESGFCSITYQLSRSELGVQPFAVGHPLFSATNDTSFGGWHQVSTECRDDYLLIGGVRLCSGLAGAAPPYDPSINMGASIQFAQNGTILNSAGVNQNQFQLQQQLQNQHAHLLQQLARLQLQQQQQQQASNGSYTNGINNGVNINGQSNLNALGQQQQGAGSIVVNNGNNLEQQQAAIMQQAMLVQQQLQMLTNNNNFIAGANQFNQANNLNNRFPLDGGLYSDLQGAIITDTTSGPFMLRFVSNMARNAKGFHIDYRQNPCK